MSDYEVKVRVRNNRILRALRDAGYESQSDFSRKTGFNLSVISGFVSMRIPAVTSRGNWANAAETLALLLNLKPEDLFTGRQRAGLRVNSVEVEMTEGQVEGLIGQSDSIEALEARQQVQSLMAMLTAREQSVIQGRLEGFTLEEIGEAQGVRSERVRQIEQKAMRKMQWRSNALDAAARDGMAIAIHPKTQRLTIA